MQLDHNTLEALVWDNTFTAVLQRTIISGTGINNIASSLRATVQNVKRHAVTFKEQAASFGAYQAGDVFFYVQDAALPPDFRPLKPGDKVTPLASPLAIPDDLDDVYTVLTVEGGRRDGLRTQKWKLNARNLRIAFDLRDLITIETPIFALDNRGARVSQWTIRYSNIPAKVQKLTQEQTEERGIRGTKTTYAVIVDRELTLSISKDRIQYQGGFLQITGYHNASRIDELPQIDADVAPGMRDAALSVG